MFHSLLTHPNSLFGQFDRLQRDLDELLGAAALPTSIRSVAGGTLPQINVGHTPQSVEVYAFAPGLDADKIEVTLDRGVLRLAGERAPAASDGERTRFHARERASGRFDRTVALPDDVDPEKVTASYRDGVLQVSIGRREAAQPKRIAIQ
ncbi:Hsp20/alpha crystallin family protein [Piscinibacter gummiphilus]|uniref:Heat-shock protein Hsp20 n=1 Tax=Piscinibacter gummiphilus TaxID=946333 RepID=A0A1W6L2U1_9BURK|nr:Hsp20/alpha crystallin family protein [Piscinibacter gummiphilus]ARN18589.1 heat-shock protein Hsp20 [Piscinibacter gummiphilus]ATU63218.1 Hsp20/alpha crystallin family protein [Piscinibacter gummiphilus]GLS95546.1 heat-shock protein Hsp20 [Piscinibacter gummiphilus]